MRCGVLAVVTVLGVACGGASERVKTKDVAAIEAPRPAVSHPAPAGCITDVSTGDHAYECGGLHVDARIPAQCQVAGCGLILELHGDTGTGLVIDAHLGMRDLGEQHGYIVVAPTGPRWPGGPGATWSPANDAALVDIVRQFAAVFRVDPKKVHVTGFSHGGAVTWRLLCEHSELFASAAPAAAGIGAAEMTCFRDGHVPARKVPIVFLIGRDDAAVPSSSMIKIRDAAAAYYGAIGPTVLAGDANYTHSRWTSPDGAVIETWDHAYKIDPLSPLASIQGHCVVGSKAPRYATSCKTPNAFAWGEEVMSFFIAHPMP